MKFPAIFYLFLFNALVLSAQDFKQAKMNSLFHLIEKSNKGMGSVSIFQNGVEVYQNTIGFLDIDRKIQANDTSKYRIGSVSKTFTAVIVMQLIDENKLSLDTKLSNFFPEIENAESITIEQLLRHRSGIYNFTNAPAYQTWMEQPKSRAELLEIIKAAGSVFEPGAKMEYSNSNYVLLSLIVEKIEGKDFAEMVQRRICDRAHLTDTYYGGTIDPGQNEAFSYTISGNGWAKATETDLSIPMGAGAIVSTPTDLNTFYEALFGGNLVSENSLSTMKKIYDNFGIGFFQIPFYERVAFGHTGGIDGFQSNVAYFPVVKVSVAYTANGVGMPINDILIGVLSIYFNKPYELPDFSPALQLTSEELNKYLGVYSSEALPLKITISRNGKTLVAQGTGQPSFPLEAFDVDQFKFDQIRLKLHFYPEEQKMKLTQSGMVYDFVKE